MGSNTHFHLTAVPVGAWAAKVTEAQPQVKRGRWGVGWWVSRVVHLG
jgi:hypothetical protein